MVAHLDAVTCLAVDPNGVFLMSGSKSRPSGLLRRGCVGAEEEETWALVTVRGVLQGSLRWGS